MFDVIVTGFLIDVLQFAVVVAATWGFLRALDYSIDVRFYGIYRKIAEDSFALAVYHGLRFIAVAFLFGSVAG